MQQKKIEAKRRNTNADMETDGVYEDKRRKIRQRGGDNAIFTDIEFPADSTSLCANWSSQDFKANADVSKWRQMEW